MMDRTDRHYRFFMRQITRRTLLYTEMINAQAIYHGDLDRLIGFTPDESPLVLQVGGDDPKLLANCARRAAEFGYSEINLNVGCPSDRVQSGNFGACLMAQPKRVADCVSAMIAASPLPVSVKHRIGIDELDRYEDMANFVSVVSATGCQRFNVHARKAWLQGLSPKDNRNIPPLRYSDVHRLKQEFPHLQIEINGGFKTLEQVKTQLKAVDAVMVGRAAYDTPFMFATADQEIFQDSLKPRSRYEVVQAMLPYMDHWITKEGAKLHSITRHMLHLFYGIPGSRIWKRMLTMQANRPNAGTQVVVDALNAVRAAEDLAAQQQAADSVRCLQKETAY